ncbi:MAG: bacillithiol biosynthesis cysteine-adding enzyme BshC [Truepera sp.]|nr:bacillithiol biosynthesis cysteine-adding enzyme BshC [Truepera sp.]
MQDPFLMSYLRGDLAPFFELSAGSLDEALDLPRGGMPEGIRRALERSARRHAAPQAVFENLNLLAQPSTRVVVTGQQPGLLLGPSYALSKAMTAIRLAESLASLGRPVIPVFWVASQDHDRVEVDHAYLLDFDERLHRIAVDLPSEVASGRMPLCGSAVDATLAALREVRAPHPFVREVSNLLEASAAVSRTFADWFVGQMYALVGRLGLVVLDPLDDEIAPHFSEVLMSEIREPCASVAAIRRAAEELRARGFAPQLGRGAQATNLFIEDRSDLPRRVLLRFDGSSFFHDNRAFTEEELCALVRDRPGIITPAAGLRPITQDAVLPNIATVVGPGELRYIAQLRGVYEHHGVAMPLVWPRASVTVLEAPVRRILSRHGLDYRSILSDSEEEFGRVVLRLHGYRSAFDEVGAILEQGFRGLLDHVLGIDPTLVRSVRHAERTHRRALGHLRAKVIRAAVERDEIMRRQFERLKRHLLPLDYPQERVISPYSFMLKFGASSYLRALEAIDPSGEQVIEF